MNQKEEYYNDLANDQIDKTANFEYEMTPHQTKMNSG